MSTFSVIYVDMKCVTPRVGLTYRVTKCCSFKSCSMQLKKWNLLIFLKCSSQRTGLLYFCGENEGDKATGGCWQLRRQSGWFRVSPGSSQGFWKMVNWSDTRKWQTNSFPAFWSQFSVYCNITRSCRTLLSIKLWEEILFLTISLKSLDCLL